MDGDETGVDCGGTICPSCETGKWEFTNASNSINDPIYRYGSVAIGMDDPGSYRLAVNGTIISKELEVIPEGWSDYVFEKDYQLMPLPDLRNYIKKHGRLPDIPSTNDVLHNGIALGEMQKALLAKIEELTLYILKQDLLIEEQNQRLLELEKKP